MKRRTLDLLLSIGGLGLAVLLLALGVVLQSQASFATSYVNDQFAAQKIYFTPAENLNDEEKKAACLVTYGTGDEAARQLLTGKEAECYANEYIALHMHESAIGAGYEGATYASLGGPQRELRGALATANEEMAPLKEALTAAQAELETATAAGTGTDEAQAKVDAAQAAVDAQQAKIDEAKKASDAVNSLRDTMFRGESLRGLLLTVYGFSVFGELAGLAALVCFAAAAVLLLLAILGFAHYARTPKEQTFEA